MKKKYTLFRPRIRSRHPSHSILRTANKLLGLLPFKSVVRLGSITEMKDSNTNGGDRVELNTVKAVENSKDKLKMKECFYEYNVKTADWWIVDNNWLFWKKLPNSMEGWTVSELTYPIIAKNRFGSRGLGNTKIDNSEEMGVWLEKHSKRLENYIFEKFYNYAREYRLHVNNETCFYTCRKMLKKNTDQDKKWFRNDQNCVWVLEENELFDKPCNWEDIVLECVKACKSTGLDFAAIDLKIQSAIDSNGNVRPNPKFIIIETNSAPSFGEKTTELYIEHIPKMLINKYERTRKEKTECII